MSKDEKQSNAVKSETKKVKKISQGAYPVLVLGLHRNAKEEIRKSLKACANFYISLDGTGNKAQCMIDVCKEIKKDDLLYKFLAQKTRQGMNKAGEKTGWVPFYLLQAIYKQREALNGKFHFKIAFSEEVEKEIAKELETVSS